MLIFAGNVYNKHRNMPRKFASVPLRIKYRVIWLSTTAREERDSTSPCLCQREQFRETVSQNLLEGFVFDQETVVSEGGFYFNIIGVRYHRSRLLSS